MNTLTDDEGFDIKALFAALFGVVLIGLLAVALASADAPGRGDAKVDEPGLPQGARYPDSNDKFAPGRIRQMGDAESPQAYPARCQGEGLLDAANYAAFVDEVGSVASYCGPNAEPAGEPDATRDVPLFPGGDGPVDPVNDY